MAWLAFGTTVRELRDGSDVIVGSGADADWRVSTADLMPRHFVVSLHGVVATVRANSTDNVVVVNGKQLVVHPEPLSSGDTILAGSGRFAFTMQPPSTAVIEEASPARAFFVDDAGKVAHPLIHRSTQIGRDASNGIVVRDPTASRFHAEARREAGGFALHSMGATGTILNGNLVRKPCMLAEGDVVEIAFVKLRFTRGAPDATLAVATPHSTKNDEAGRKPTLGGGGPAVRNEGNDAKQGGGSRGVQIVVAVILFALAAIWWLIRSGA